MSQTLVRELSEFVFNITYQRLPKEIRAIALQHLLDTLGCCLASVNSDTSKALKKYILSEQGTNEATAIGISQLLPVTQAAFMNGLLARAVEFDDMAMPDLHPSGVMVPIVLALAEVMNSKGVDIISTLAIGLELCIRLARAGFDPINRTSRFLKRGQDSTAICGAVAGAAIAAKLLGLDKNGIANAMGVAVSFASGSLEANRSGGNIKQLQSGWAAKSAIQAALLTKYGITGPTQALEGQYGFYRCFIDGKFDASILVEQLGNKWLLSELRYKPYPCNYYTHAGIDAVLALRKKDIKISEIESMELAVASPMLRTVGEPIERKQNPRNAYEAKFSAPYTIAAALIGGKGLGLGIDDFNDELVKEPTRITLMQKVNVISDKRCDAIFPDHAPAILTINMKDGKRCCEEIFVNRGSSENPLTEKEIAIKFENNAVKNLTVDKVNELYALINGIEKLKNIRPIVTLLRQAG